MRWVIWECRHNPAWVWRRQQRKQKTASPSLTGNTPIYEFIHRRVKNRAVTCTAAPIFNPAGELKAVLDISALTSPQQKQSQHLALQLVKMFSHHIENAYFLYRFRKDWILRLSSAPEFLEVNPDYLLAVDASGRQQLIEQLAGLINDKKIPILEDVRDESDEAVQTIPTIGFNVETLQYKNIKVRAAAMRGAHAAPVRPTLRAGTRRPVERGFHAALCIAHSECSILPILSLCS